MSTLDRLGRAPDPASYVPHAVHRDDRVYRETNCWTDVVLEVLHARGYEPLAAMGATARLDFEGDQWTFFKPHPVDLELLFGVDIHEMQPYRPLPEQIGEQLAAGRLVLVEVDGWFLPDTAGTSYGREHVKTTIAAAAIDTAAETLHYFHNAGLYALSGPDYRGVFRTDPSAFADEVLPPYVELARFDVGAALTGAALRDAATDRLRHHLALRPTTNPFLRFGERLATDLPLLLERDATHFHEYAFATVRMAGAGFELLGSHVSWLWGDDDIGSTVGRIVDDCKLLSFKLARRRAFDPAPVVDRLAVAWDDTMTKLDAACR